MAGATRRARPERRRASSACDPLREADAACGRLAGGEASRRPRRRTCGRQQLWRARTLAGHAAGCARSRSGENRSQITPHLLRRTFATDLLNRGVRIETLARLLGHTSPTITARACAHLLDETIRAELAAVLAGDGQQPLPVAA
jgi:integrase